MISFQGQDPCEQYSTSLLVSGEHRALVMCLNGRTHLAYRVSIGSEGFYKTLKGDFKTPVGSYRLGQPRPSKKFGIFIPIHYPTPEQRAEGFSGGAIGLHGPHPRHACAGELSLKYDWTGGCIALPSDLLVKEVAEFMQFSGASRIHILAP